MLVNQDAMAVESDEEDSPVCQVVDVICCLCNLIGQMVSPECLDLFESMFQI